MKCDKCKGEKLPSGLCLVCQMFGSGAKPSKPTSSPSCSSSREVKLSVQAQKEQTQKVDEKKYCPNCGSELLYGACTDCSIGFGRKKKLFPEYL